MVRMAHFSVAILLCVAINGWAAEPELIPRRVLFDNPDKAAARISPDGKQISYLAPVDGVLNVWVGPIDDPDAAQPVTKDTKRGIRSYFWAYTNQHILYRQDVGGDEDWHVYSVEVGQPRDQGPHAAGKGLRTDPGGQPPLSGSDPRRPERPRPAASRCLSHQHPHRQARAGAEESWVFRLHHATTT